jgi:hypothetical protein
LCRPIPKRAKPPSFGWIIHYNTTYSFYK